jgi:AraC-like DNA-binding protein
VNHASGPASNTSASQDRPGASGEAAMQTPPLVGRGGAALRLAPVFIRPVLDEVERRGVDLRHFCQGLAVSVDDMDAPGMFLSHAECVTLIRRALPAIGRPDLGLKLGMRSNLVSRGAQAIGLLASATLGEAIAMTMRFPSSAGLLLDVHDEQSNAEHVLTADGLPGDLDIQPFLAEQLFSSIVKTRRQLVTADHAPKLVDFMHAKPASTKMHEQYFNCPVRFARPRNLLITDRHWLDFRLPTADLRTYRFACEVQEREAEQAAAGTNIAMMVERAILRQLPHIPALADLASSLNMSERTLRRRLAEGGPGYQELVDQVRRTSALELIVTARAPLAQVAARTGFSDVRTLRRAVKRWTGQVPSDLRP